MKQLLTCLMIVCVALFSFTPLALATEMCYISGTTCEDSCLFPEYEYRDASGTEYQVKPECANMNPDELAKKLEESCLTYVDCF